MKQLFQNQRAPKFALCVDLSNCGCDNQLSRQFSKHDTNDKESWNNSWNDLCTDIGNELKDDKWEEKYDLFETKSEKEIKNLDQFIRVFEDVPNINEPVFLHVGVKL